MTVTEPIEVFEHGRVAIPDDVANATAAEFWKSIDCTVSRGVADPTWTLQAGNSVGVTRVSTLAGEVTVHIRPKLETADVFFLADYAYEQRHDPLTILDHDQVTLDVLLRDPSACLLAWHARTIRAFAARWLRRDYHTARRVLDGKAKGRIVMNRYVSAHLALGDAARVPCQIQERTQDTPNNRVLKAGLRYIANASHALPVPAARRAVMRQVNATLPLFANVSDIRVSPSDIRSTSTKGAQRHYTAVLRATLGLLQGKLMGDQLGTTSATHGFMWRMPTLFQEAVRGLLDSAPEMVLETARPGSARIHDADGARRRTSKVDPDLVLRGMDGATLLLVDTKYKDALPTSLAQDSEDETVTQVSDRHRIKVSRSDIYQVVAYRQHERWPGSIAALLYPVVLSETEDLPPPMTVRGFGDNVLLMFIDVGRRARSNLPTFLETIRSLTQTVPMPCQTPQLSTSVHPR